MCEAFRQQMTAKEGYVWFLPTWFIPKWYDTDAINLPGKEAISCNTSEMIQVVYQLLLPQVFLFYHFESLYAIQFGKMTIAGHQRALFSSVCLFCSR